MTHTSDDARSAVDAGEARSTLDAGSAVDGVSDDARSTSEPRSAVDTIQRTDADRFVCDLLRVPDGPKVSLFAAENAMRRSIILSGIRCTLTYIVIPFIVPFIGLAAAIDAPLGIAVGLAAMLSLVTTVRRFFMANHPRRWWYTWFAVVMFAFLIFLMVRDGIRLFE